MPYDVTEMRARLNGFMREINDLSTSQEDVERYASFNAALHDINEQTEYYYQPLPNGSYPTLDAEGLKKLQASYEAALEQTGSLLAGQGGGAVAERMRGIAREMTPLLRSDSAALDMAGKEPMPLPELVGRAREQAVDLGAQQTTSQSGQLSSRQHIYVENNGVTEDGFFTATSRVEPDKKYQQLMDQLQSKYPPQYRPLIDDLRGKYQDAVVIDYSGSPYWGMGGDTPEETRDAMRATWKDDIHGTLGTDGALKEVEEDAQYLSFMDDFYSAMRGISAEYTSYKSGKLAVCEDGANIDRRNVGMSRVAGMLGKPELVANARPMMLIQNGVAVSGTFMQTADGVDLTNTKPTDPIRGYQTENFNNPEVFDDIAAMQGIDFICGNIDRHPGNFFMRFNPRDGEKGKLVGITLIDNDLSFSNATASAQERTGSKFVLPDEMGVIGEDFYNAMKVMTKEQLQASLSDCGLSAQEIDWAWQRKEALQAKIEKDLAYFQDKEPGYIEAGRLRVVPKTEWGAYSIQELAEVHKDSQFQAITRTPETAKTYENKREQEQKKAQEAETVRREALAQPPEVEKSAPKAPTPVGKVVGSGLAHESDPLNIAREGTLKLASPGLSHIKPVGNNLSRRYPISWNADGKEHKGFLTPELSIRADATVRQGLDIAIEQNPQYADVLGSIRNYYTFDRETRADKVNLTGKAEKLPWEEMGIEADRVDALMKDRKFERMWQETAYGINKALGAQILYGIAGVERGRRIDLRNVAMSDVGDVLGVPDLLARSSTVQLEADGHIIEGVVMEAAEGFELSGVKDGDPMARITAEQASEVYNTESGVKSLADMQILDYVCMNRDRHKANMFYRFEGQESGQPRFFGVQGIDNDYSFGTRVPQPAEYVDKLSSLNDMQVISAGMAAKIRDPGTKEAIAEKM
ncbi:MAG: hypothetical protein IJV64_00670, partial [Oscillospiraceae bacterium]|nr:hypothetical protein [Oscillospiraceae bacterium]